MLVDDLADVTASEPGYANADWQLIPVQMAVVAKTANYSIAEIEMSVGNVIFTNEGAAGAIEITLPERTGPLRCGFMVVAAQYLKVIPPSGERIYYIDSQQTAEDGYVRSNLVGTYFEILGTASTGYTIIQLSGSLKVDE
jgi:hypothetical protein